MIVLSYNLLIIEISLSLNMKIFLLFLLLTFIGLSVAAPSENVDVDNNVESSHNSDANLCDQIQRKFCAWGEDHLSMIDQKCFYEKLELLEGSCTINRKCESSDKYSSDENILLSFAGRICLNQAGKSNYSPRGQSRPYIKTEFKNNLKCLKLKLSEIDSESPLLNGFESKSIGNEELENCQTFLIDFEETEVTKKALNSVKSTFIEIKAWDCASSTIMKNLQSIIFRFAIIANSSFSAEVVGIEEETVENLVNEMLSLAIKCSLKQMKGENFI